MAEKIAVVTGANRGLGLAVVKGLCKRFEGIVYLTSRDPKRGLESVDNLKNEGLEPKYHSLDVTRRESVKTFAEFIRKQHGGLDVLVNNAAILNLDDDYPSYENAKLNIDTNFKSLLTIEEYLFPLLRKGSRVVNVSSACGHLSNLRNKTWIDLLKNEDLTEEQLVKFVDDYLESVKNGTFEKANFADEGRHSEHRVSKIAVTALTMIQQKKYFSRGISINAVHPGLVQTEMAKGKGDVTPDEAAKNILYLVLEASENLKGTFMWHDRKLVDWYDSDGDYYHKFCKD